MEQAKQEKKLILAIWNWYIYNAIKIIRIMQKPYIAIVPITFFLYKKLKILKT